MNDVFNAIFIRGNTLGDSMYYGRGAGKLPTASAVVSDVIDCAKHGRKHIICIWEEEKLSLKSVDDASRKFFVRVSEGAEPRWLSCSVTWKNRSGRCERRIRLCDSGDDGKGICRKNCGAARLHQSDPHGRRLKTGRVSAESRNR